jgi:NitT/TauT family transport system ATP-binding protein
MTTQSHEDLAHEDLAHEDLAHEDLAHEDLLIASGSTFTVGPEAPARPVVSIAGVTKTFGHGSQQVVALEGVTLDIERGEFVCLLGASGCGKSTLLNLVAGLDRPTTGTVDVNAERTGLMFQEAALFPWLTVRGNVELALKLAGTGRGERRARGEELLEMVHLEDFAKRRPHELSGGMRQRVALARALAQDADVLLMDEPFGALDAMTRDLLHDELEALWSTTGKTVMFVTHNVREAVRLGDCVVLLASRPGRVAAVYDVTIPRPRRIDSTEVATLAATITDQLRQEAGHGRRD